MYKSACDETRSRGSLGPDNCDDPPGRVYNNRHDEREVLRARIIVYVHYSRVITYIYMPTTTTAVVLYTHTVESETEISRRTTSCENDYCDRFASDT